MKKNKKCNRYCVDPHEMMPDAYEKVVQEYVAYYHKKSKFYKRLYTIVSIFKMLLLVAIPVMEVIDAENNFGWIVTIASSLCIMVETLKEMFHLRKKWILYQHTNNLLMSEQRLYHSRAGEYAGKSDDDSFVRYVDNVEKIISNEDSDWEKTLNSYKERE